MRPSSRQRQGQLQQCGQRGVGTIAAEMAIGQIRGRAPDPAGRGVSMAESGGAAGAGIVASRFALVFHHRHL